MLFCVICVFCRSVVLVRLSLLVQLIDWKDSSPKCPIIIIIIIIVTYKQRSLKKLRRAAGICHSVLRNRCAFRCRAKVAVDSDERRRSVGRLFEMSGSETAKFLRPMVVAVRCTLSFVLMGTLHPAHSLTHSSLSGRVLVLRGTALKVWASVVVSPLNKPAHGANDDAPLG